MGDMMKFPESIEKFLDDYSFKDAEQVYTNCTELIPVYRVKQAFEHYDVVNAIQVLDKIREFIDSNRISCPECIYQKDSVQKPCLHLFADLVEHLSDLN